MSRMHPKAMNLCLKMMCPSIPPQDCCLEVPDSLQREKGTETAPKRVPNDTVRKLSKQFQVDPWCDDNTSGVPFAGPRTAQNEKGTEKGQRRNSKKIPTRAFQTESIKINLPIQ